jgi:hypothetical protein
MTSLKPVSMLFWLAAAYDGILGVIFVVAAPWGFATAGIPAPDTWGYVHFAAGLLITFALMFVALARDPVANANLIVYGVLLKVSYVSAVAWHWGHEGVPAVWKWFGVADIVFAGAFLWAMGRISAAQQPQPA